jgi:hypothetical protein
MNSLIGTVKDVMGDLSTAQKRTGLGISNPGITEAVENILRSIWLLLAALHVLI